MRRLAGGHQEDGPGPPNRVLDGHLREHQKYIEALEGHVSGLEHNIEVLTDGLTASEARYQAPSWACRRRPPPALFRSPRPAACTGGSFLPPRDRAERLRP